MIDIHSHVLPFVDDGSDGYECSFNMLDESVKQGVTDIILTPHYKKMFHKTPAEIKEIFERFNALKNEKGIPINLFLGQEIFAHRDTADVLKAQKAMTLNDTNNVLVEYRVSDFSDIVESVYMLKTAGYNPIIAHAERYSYFTPLEVQEVKSMGGRIQVNASSLIGKDGRACKVRSRLLVKFGLVDFVASDSHFHRDNSMAKAYAFVKRKYGIETANKLFTENAKEIIQG